MVVLSSLYYLSNYINFGSISTKSTSRIDVECNIRRLVCERTVLLSWRWHRQRIRAFSLPGPALLRYFQEFFFQVVNQIFSFSGGYIYIYIPMLYLYKKGLFGFQIVSSESRIFGWKLRKIYLFDWIFVTAAAAAQKLTFLWKVTAIWDLHYVPIYVFLSLGEN